MFGFLNQNNDIIALKKKINELESTITLMKSEILSVTVDQKIIRDKVLRKIQFKKPQEEEQEEENNTPNAMTNNPMFLP
jgi:hypothetical protein